MFNFTLAKTNLFILAQCSCKDLLSPDGEGNCIKHADFGALNNQLFCYVNKPSSCADLLSSSSIPGEIISAEACTNEGT